MILPAQHIRRRCLHYQLITPFEERAKITLADGRSVTYGLGPASYDVRVAEDLLLYAGGPGVLGSTIERFSMPDDLQGIVHDKSSWARRFLLAQNTLIDPGWRGYLTLELTNNSANDIYIRSGDPIAQIAFHMLLEPTEQPYAGKYQDQEAGAQPPR